MGLFDSLFGGGKKAEAPPVSQAAPAVAQPAASSAAPLDPEIPAAIAASIMSAAYAAAITAAIVHAQGGATALRFKRPGNLWALSGRQAIMAGRQR